MIFMGLCIYLILGIIIFMSNKEARESINECIEEATTLKVVIIFSILVLVCWLPLLIYAKADDIYKHFTNKESK